MTGAQRVELTINGEVHDVRAHGATTLLDVLRDQLALNGAKRGCNQGVCGACNILLDGKPVRACLVVAAIAAGREITTIEGLEQNGELSPMQQAFLDTGAVQCGFCMPGMVITATALVADNPKAGVEEIRSAISGNLCRCSGYVKVVDAIRHVTGA
ncbi:MAG TPA: (2Fe-2S)-binding protein [Alphaproteobacteria bacterium]|nr:(2Fe-2S)-binding protein [Alphaproteobacteria bacterium]